MYRNILLFSAFSGALTVAFGAMGAHTLRNHFHVDESHMQIFETGVRYQAWHTLALMGIGILSLLYPAKTVAWAGKMFITGILFFSGSLFFLALRPVFGIPDEHWKGIGALTPLGGIAFITGWILLFVYILKLKK
ncbi:MAG: DUF423 domain-containing protein [Bacteroidia bacterium]